MFANELKTEVSFSYKEYIYLRMGNIKSNIDEVIKCR